MIKLSEKLNCGDYVLATKYHDGDPHDHWFVGFFRDITWHGRYNIIDNNGNMPRGNGFRKARRISSSTGRFLIKNMNVIQANDISLWWWMRYARKIKMPEEKGDGYMKEYWHWTCLTCGNHALVKWDDGRPSVCHIDCGKPDWKLLKVQQPYEIGGEPWIHLLGEE